VEVYYEKSLKLTNNLPHMTTYIFLIIVFRSRLQPYQRVTTTCMKKETLQQHKEAILVFKNEIFEVEAINNLLIPHNSKTILAQKPQIITKKTRMCCTNYD